MSDQTPKRLVLVDGNSLLYRGFFSMRALTTSAGQPTNAVFSFTMMLLTLLTAKPAGTGLGLPITREIVRAHGGTVCCMDRSGGGAVFVLRLPPQSPFAATAREETGSPGATAT